jgi:putative transposase
MGERITKNLVEESLIRSILNRRPEKGLIHHSDRGSQYCSREYRKMLDHYGVIASIRNLTNT